MRATLEDWIPKSSPPRNPTAICRPRSPCPGSTRAAISTSSTFKHWDPAHRGDHEGYTAGYFLESAINHYLMTNKKDARLYNAAKKLADCWHTNLGPAPKKPWYDGHQEMEQALVRFGRFVNDMEGGGKGDQYIETGQISAGLPLHRGRQPDARPPGIRPEPLPGNPAIRSGGSRGSRGVHVFRDGGCRRGNPRSRLPERRQVAVGQHRQQEILRTGGMGSGETSEGFGPNYSLRNSAYCESCSSCGEIFFQWKMNLAYHDAKYVDLYEETMYNALLGNARGSVESNDSRVVHSTTPFSP